MREIIPNESVAVQTGLVLSSWEDDKDIIASFSHVYNELNHVICSLHPHKDLLPKRGRDFLVEV